MVKVCFKIVFFLLVLVPTYIGTQSAQACCGCMSSDCSSAQSEINQLHQDITDNTNQEFDDDLRAFQDWVVDEFFSEEIMPALRMFTTQMNIVSMQQMQILGAFFDAKNQMETQRTFQELQAEAHRDYIPSDSFCAFGTNIRSMPASAAKGRINAYYLAKKSFDRQVGGYNTKSSHGAAADMQSRWNYFRTSYCDASDNNRNMLGWYLLRDRGTGLQLACDHDGPGGSNDVGAEDAPMRTNIDIDYTKLIDLPRTLDIDLTDSDARKHEEQDVIALGENLYGHRVLSRSLDVTRLKNPGAQNVYLALRSIAAKRNVAQNTYHAIVGLKAAGSAGQYESIMGALAPLAVGHTRQYLGAILRNLYPYEGVLVGQLSGPKLTDGDIYTLMGDDPSYFSQLEIMGKKMYQDPDFYVKLYDTPANVARTTVAMKAIELMMDREMYESQLRREMTVSVLLSSKLHDLERRVSSNIVRAKKGTTR